MAKSPLITLTTDFGTTSPYVAAMKGVVLSINPAATLLDLTHSIRPQDLRHANYFLTSSIPYFPPDTIHLCVVDPGVGSERAALYVKANGQQLVGPDNGIFSGVIRKANKPITVRQLTDHRYWRSRVSQTFHGRDIFAPVAAHLSLGIDPSALGPELPEPVELPTHSAVTFENRWQGEVQFVDDFGNLITNIPACKLKLLPVKVSVAGVPGVILRWVRTYSDATQGELVSLFSSDGYFEIAEVNGNAAKRLGVAAGAVVELEAGLGRKDEG
jgi:S-adenosyl-L-methionine hydrolase (adenosine-forming)